MPMSNELKEKMRLGRERAKEARASKKLNVSVPPEDEPDRLGELSSRVDKLVDLVGSLAEKVMTPVATIPVVPLPVNMASPVVLADLAFSDVPNPPSWEAKMKEILDDRFEMEIIEGGDGNFVMKVYVPEDLKRDRTNKGRDYSSGLIRRASALADVETWCKKILTNIKTVYPSFKS